MRGLFFDLYPLRQGYAALEESLERPALAPRILRQFALATYTNTGEGRKKKDVGENRIRAAYSFVGRTASAMGCTKYRYVFALLACAGMAIIYGVKVNLSVAIVAMVNHMALAEAAAIEGAGSHNTGHHGGGHHGLNVTDGGEDEDDALVCMSHAGNGTEGAEKEVRKV